MVGELVPLLEEDDLGKLVPLQKAIDSDDILRAIPARRAPGRHRKTRGGLDRDDNDTRFFSLNNLIKILTQSPGYVFHWSVMKEFPVKKRGQVSQEHVAGRIMGWQKNRGRFAWSILFTNGKTQELECHDLAELLAYSYAMGMNVDGLPE
jgi:hypothetical protein